MRNRPDKNFKLEWPGGIVPEWAKTKQNLNKRRGGKGARGAGPGGGKRERLQKVMAQSGHGSRRNIEILIAQGHITINGQPAKLGDSVGPGDKVKLDGKLIHLRFGEPLPRVLMYHKPTGEIVTRDDPEKRPTVFDKLPRVNNGRWVSVGRLDFNTEGLLIFTTNGDLANKLTHPRFEVEREYAVRVMGELTEEQQKKLLEEGVDIDGELCKFDRIEDRGGEGSNHWYHVVLREGKNREVRRMMESVGLMVSRLIRVRFGNTELPGFLKRGQMREMEEEQIQELLAFAGVGEEAQASESQEDEEDEHDNIGNRIADMPRARDEEPEIDDDIGNRFHAREQQRIQQEADGNRAGQHTPAPRPPKGQGQAHGQGQPQHQQRRGQGGGKPFAFGKKRGAQQQHGQGKGQQGGNPQHRKPGPSAQGQAQAPGQPQGGAPAQGAGNGQAAGNGQGKPGRHRRHKNRNRNRGGGDAQPATNTNREPVQGT